MENDNLKMKFKLHSLEFEIEGREATVKEEFADFKNFITSQLVNKINIITPPQPLTQSPVSQQIDRTGEDVIDLTNSELPALKEVVIKDLPNSEIEWILIYSLYASNNGTQAFTQTDIRNLYDSSGRKETNRLSNFSYNFNSNINKGYIKILNDTEYLILQTGIGQALKILSGEVKSASPTRKSVKKKKAPVINQANDENENKKETPKNKTKRKIDFIDLDLPIEEINRLNQFFEDKKPKTQNEEALVVMKWFKDHRKNSEIKLEEISYLLSICSKVPNALEQVLINMKGPNFRWITKLEDGGFQLTSIGENIVHNKLPKE